MKLIYFNQSIYKINIKITGDHDDDETIYSSMDNSVATNAFDVVAGHSFGGLDETEIITDPIGNDDDDGDDPISEEESSEDRPTCSQPQCTNDIEMRDIYVAEAKKVDDFIDSGCGCTLYGGQQCSSAFTREHYTLIRDQFSSFLRPELHNVLFGHVMATVRTSADIDNPRHPSKSRSRNTTTFMHEGHKVYMH